MTVQTYQPTSQPPNNNTDDIVRIMPTTEDLKRPHSEKELIESALADLPKKRDNLIASSREQLPRITVNGVQLDETAIAQEMQYHPADSKEDALYASAQALVMRHLLKKQVLQDDELGQSAWEADEEKAISDLLAKNIPVDNANDDSYQRYYQQNKEKYITDPKLSIRHILLAVAPDAGDERLQCRKQAYQLIERIQNSVNPQAEFIEMVRQYSDCPSKEEGGELGQLYRGQTVAEFESKVFALDKGLAPSPIETRYGFHIVEVLEREEGVQLTYEQAKPAIINHFQQQSFHHGLVDYLYILVQNADIQGIQMTMQEENVYRG